MERDSAATRAVELASRADRAEQLADAADARIDAERERADRAEQRADAAEMRADAAEIRIDRDAATARALQDTLRAALDLPSMEDVTGGRRGVQVGDTGAVTVQPGGLIGVDEVPELMDGELAAGSPARSSPSASTRRRAGPPTSRPPPNRPPSPRPRRRRPRTSSAARPRHLSAAGAPSGTTGLSGMTRSTRS
ncbi:hypothetical protein LUX57_26635 [Actinomadura madurae]|uniref:hypothetical protein n=1 Tax=Actinomadura madurae TaxID=1993 RepID=UPI0020D23877|nr:hypothetical protein [Actinomadura madurae]MCP9968302.1 hypothetical protein [Actinomadura madurae]